MSNPPIKTCDYCGTQGTMPTYMDGETCCSACSRSLPRDIPSARKLVLSLRNQLTESQAREAHMRTEMEKIADWHGSWGPFPENNEAWRSMVVVTARQATKLPHDDTALKARLKAERERCAKAFSQWDRDGRWAAGVIRNLGDE